MSELEQLEAILVDLRDNQIPNLAKELAEKDQLIENLKMVCRRIAAAKTLESRDRIAYECYSLFSGSPIRGGASAESEG